MQPLKDLKQGDKFSLARGKYLNWIEIEQVFEDGSILVCRGGRQETWDFEDVLDNDLVFVPDQE